MKFETLTEKSKHDWIPGTLTALCPVQQASILVLNFVQYFFESLFREH